MLVRLVELAFTYTPFVVKVVTVIIRSVVHISQKNCNVTDHLMFPTHNRGSVRVELFNRDQSNLRCVAAARVSIWRPSLFASGVNVSTGRFVG